MSFVSGSNHPVYGYMIMVTEITQFEFHSHDQAKATVLGGIVFPVNNGTDELDVSNEDVMGGG